MKSLHYIGYALHLIAFVLLAYVLAGCTELGSFDPFNLNTAGKTEGKIFKKDLEITVNGKRGRGVLVVPKHNEYEVKVTLEDRVELVKLRSCHREISAEKSGFRGRKGHTFKFKAEVGIENEGACLVHIGAYDVGGRNSWALFDIQNEELSAEIQCNGARAKSKGVSICQTREGLHQRITFEDEVDVISTCEVDQDSGKVFDIYAENGLCIYVFHNEEKQEFHRFSIYGYTDILFKVIKARNQ